MDEDFTPRRLYAATVLFALFSNQKALKNIRKEAIRRGENATEFLAKYCIEMADDMMDAE